MNIDIDSNDLITALSQKITALTVELETNKLALLKAQEICTTLSDALAQVLRDEPDPAPAFVEQLDDSTEE